MTSLPCGATASRGSSLCALLGVDRDALAHTIAVLAGSGRTVAAAESLTAGLLTATLTEIPGASAVVRGGIVCYATDIKSELLGVDRSLLAEMGPVDEEVACQLARGVRRRCHASLGIGVTGVAGPDPQGGRAPGTVFAAISDGHHDAVQRLTPAMIFGSGVGAQPLSRHGVRAAAVQCALSLLGRWAEAS